MRACIQRVSRAQVSIVNAETQQPEIVGKIGLGLVVLIGVAEEDEISDVEYLANKSVQLRIFNDDEGKMNRSLLDVGGELLAISQFTLMVMPAKEDVLVLLTRLHLKKVTSCMKLMFKPSNVWGLVTWQQVSSKRIWMSSWSTTAPLPFC